jgi:hypothetical protein
MDIHAVQSQKRSARLSAYMKAKIRGQQTGEKVNACPFGCADEALDDRGYCHHLVGFCTVDDRKRMERVVIRNGVRQVDGQKRDKVLPDDKLVQITTSFRVYRDVDPTEADKAILEALREFPAEPDDEAPEPREKVGPPKPVRMTPGPGKDPDKPPKP